MVIKGFDGVLNNNHFEKTNNNIQESTHLTEEILLEAMEKIKDFDKKENMQKLLREFLESIEKNNITEILFYNNQYKIKDGQAIFMI